MYFILCLSNITKKLKTLGVEPELKKTELGRQYVQDVKNLPLLEAKYIEPAFEAFTRSVQNYQETILVNEKEITIQTLCQPFIDYFRKVWLKTVWPVRMSVYKTNHRTNNPLERRNQTFHEYAGTHPSLLSFLGFSHYFAFQS